MEERLNCETIQKEGTLKGMGRLEERGSLK